MKFIAGLLPVLLALLEGNVDAFAPTSLVGPRQSTARAFSPMDASNLQDLSHHVQSIQDFMSTLSVADAVQAVDPGAATDVATEAAKSGSGPFGFLTAPIEAFLQFIHSALVGVGLDSNSWGISIISLTLIIKLLTYPLTKAQLESTQKMQALQPTLKGIQAKYQSNPEVMNQKIAELYQTNEVNPLAGCIPSLVQLPVFIGLYRAVLDLASENVLDEPFLWLPSLEGPLYGAEPTKGTAWLFDWVNGAPSLGWEDTAAFLVLPIFLVISQFASMEIMTPKETKDQQPAFLKFLPLMIGWFSLGVPSALSVYWVTNNLVTTASSVLIRNSIQMDTSTVVTSADSAATAAPANPNVFTPPTIREKPEGFGSTAAPSSGGVTPITNSDVVDAEVVSEIVSNSEDVVDAPAAPKKRGSKKKKKRRKN